MTRIWLIVAGMLIWAPHLTAQETAEEWTMRLGYIEKRDILLGVLGRGEGMYEVDSGMPNDYRDFADLNRGAVYTLNISAYKEHAFVSNLTFVSHRAIDDINNLWEKRSNDELSRLDYHLISWEFPEEMKPFTGDMPFGLRMGMSKEEVKNILGHLPQQMEPSRYEYNDLFSLGESSSMTMRIDDDEGLYYLDFALGTPGAVVKIHQTYRDKAMVAIRAGIEAALLWQGTEFIEVGDALYAFMNASSSSMPGADILGTTLIDRSDHRWRATWCEHYPEFITPRFEQLRDMVVNYAADEMDMNEDIVITQVEGDHPDDIFWVREDEAATFRQANQHPLFRLNMDKAAGHISLEAVSPNGINGPPLKKAVCGNQ